MANSLPDRRTRFTRRRFLRLAGLAGLAGPAAALLPFVRAEALLPARRWSDPATWGGRLPGKMDVVEIAFPVLLDMDARVAGVVIRLGGNLIFHPRKSVRLASTGNVVVRGRLTMRPETHTVRHRLVFLNVDESRFQGGGMKVLRSDVGLWVMHHGQLSIRGGSKLAWTRTARGVPAGATTLELRNDPDGWQVGDQLVLTPTASPATPHHTRYDSARIAAISGRTITLSRSTRYAHPAVEVRPGVVLTPEVLNLSRNVRIEGTRRGRAHIFIHSMHAQNIRHASIRYMGPRKSDGYRSHSVLGRYGLHFHHCGDGSRSSVVAGVVVSRTGSHAFVPHLSHGIAFRNCISHDTMEEAYWWDPPTNNNRSPNSFTNETLFDRCVASLVVTRPPDEPPQGGSRLSGFTLGTDGPVPLDSPANTCVGCVAVGVIGGSDASGFHWPEHGQGVWRFENNIAHNCFRHGIFVWQNDDRDHRISRFVAYHNGGSGISQGAYGNRYLYEDSALYGNRETAIVLHAMGSMTFRRIRCDGAGISPEAVRSTKHSAESNVATLFQECEFLGYAGTAAVVSNAQRFGDVMDFINCTFSGNEFWVLDAVPADTLLRVQDSVHSPTEIRRKDQPGTLALEWNASVTEIANFALGTVGG